MATDRVEALVQEHMLLARTLARQMKSRAGYRADFDSLYSDAMLGLWQAAEKWEGGGEFGAYATTFIRRRMLDGLRQHWRTKWRVEPISLEEMNVKPPRATSSVEATVLLHERMFEHVIVNHDRRTRVTTLTTTEADVLAGAAAGEQATDTARRRVCALDTVKTHRKHILRKLAARDMAQAVYIAMCRGELSAETKLARAA